jgi:protocatechuate 3,4-dioxygenase beta subunit
VGTEPLLRDWDLDSGISVQGKVERANGRPFPNANVQLTPKTAGVTTLVSCTSDEEGAFDCTGLEPGEYDISVGVAPVTSPRSITLPAGKKQLPPIVLRASAAATILARIASNLASLGTFSGFARRGNEPPRFADIDNDGFARFDVPLGEYRVYLGPTSIAPENAALAVLRADGERVHVELAVPSLLDISGVVVDTNGQPVPDSWVHAESTGIAGRGMPMGVPSLTNEAGEFTVRHLIPGGYHLLAEGARPRSKLRAVQAGATNVIVHSSDGVLLRQ